MDGSGATQTVSWPPLPSGEETLLHFEELSPEPEDRIWPRTLILRRDCSRAVHECAVRMCMNVSHRTAAAGTDNSWLSPTQFGFAAILLKFHR
jgi:hypothetical protein